MRNILILLVISVIPLSIYEFWPKAPPSNTEVVTLVTENNVVMYATSWCGYCKKAREFFRANNIEYTEYDVEESAEARQEFNDLGGRGVPVIVINEEVIHGLSLSKMRKALQL